jgi:hypothetical protein
MLRAHEPTPRGRNKGKWSLLHIERVLKRLLTQKVQGFEQGLPCLRPRKRHRS